MPSKLSAEHDPTLLERLAACFGWHSKGGGAQEDVPRAKQAFIVRSVGQRVTVGLVNADKLADVGDIENEVALDEVSDVNFEKELIKSAIEGGILKTEDNNRSAISSLVGEWLKSARKDREFISQVLENHKDVHANAAEASRRAQEVLARFG